MTRSALIFGCLILLTVPVNAGKKKSPPPQLYLRADVEYPEKGYIEQKSKAPASKSVFFRRCDDLQPVVVSRDKLSPISGSCAPSEPNWVGTISNIDSGGNAIVYTTKGNRVKLTATTLQKYPDVEVTIGTPLGGMKKHLFAVER